MKELYCYLCGKHLITVIKGKVKKDSYAICGDCLLKLETADTRTEMPEFLQELFNK